MDEVNLTIFDKERASQYDQQWDRLMPIQHTLHTLIQIAFANLKEASHILCVGVGTGAELIALAKAFPTFKFTGIDISQPMLNVCHEKINKEGLSSRCHLIVDKVENLFVDVKFDAATAILVSHFIMNIEDRIQFFKEVANRLHPDSPLISADLSLPAQLSTKEQLDELWVKAMVFAGMDTESAKKSTSQWGKNVSVLPKNDIENILRSSGFENPTIFYKALFINAWISKLS